MMRAKARAITKPRNGRTFQNSDNRADVADPDSSLWRVEWRDRLDESGWHQRRSEKVGSL
jgi:hypothetical protein